MAMIDDRKSEGRSKRDRDATALFEYRGACRIVHAGVMCNTPQPQKATRKIEVASYTPARKRPASRQLTPRKRPIEKRI